MSKLTETQIRQILCEAATQPLMILTVSEDTAMQIKESFMQFLRFFMWQNLVKVNHRYQVFVKGYERIDIMPIDVWKKEKYRLQHKGVVIITNRHITDIPDICNEPIPMGVYLAKLQEKYARFFPDEQIEMPVRVSEII